MDLIVEILRKAIFLGFVVGFAVFVKYDHRYHWLYRQQQRLLNPRTWRERARNYNTTRVLKIFALSLVGILALMVLIPMFTEPFKEVTNLPYAQPDNFQVVLYRVSPLLLLGVSLALAPLEEWMFRGLIQERLQYWGKIRAILVAASLFSLLHLSNLGYELPALIPPAVAGIVLGVIYLRGGLVPCTLTHMGYNGVTVIMAMLF